VRPTLFAAAIGLAAGCSLFVDAGGLSTASESGPNDGSTDSSGPPVDAISSSDGDAFADGGAGDAADSGCPSAVAPVMVRVTDANGTFCIDATEVTNRQLTAFINSTVRPTPPAKCAFKTSYGGAIRPDDDLPATDVDWCDAWMYCAWAGKRLCGSRNGTVIDEEIKANNAQISEWFAACSLQGTRDYPYPGDFSPSACNTCQNIAACSDGGSPLVPVGSRATCEGGYPGLFDMSGNVNEWEDNCNSSDTCPPRGGNATTGAADSTCAMGTSAPLVNKRNQKGPRTGIRCCAN
jgi:formylglycine-generating enzyme